MTYLDLLDAVGSLLAGIGTCVLAYAAFVSIPKSAQIFKEGNAIAKNAQDENLAHEIVRNKISLAKETIRAFYNFRIAFLKIRSPWVDPSENEAAFNWLAGDNSKLKKNSGVVCLYRMQQHLETVEKLQELEAEFVATFGEVNSFDLSRKAWNSLKTHAELLANGSININHMDPFIWLIDSKKDNDEIYKDVENAVEQIKKVVSPYLRGNL